MADGRFYVVVGSFYDEDLAEDKAKAIVAGGESAYGIPQEILNTIESVWLLAMTNQQPINLKKN